jgi:hypothetical protein
MTPTTTTAAMTIRLFINCSHWQSMRTLTQFKFEFQLVAASGGLR